MAIGLAAPLLSACSSGQNSLSSQIGSIAGGFAKGLFNGPGESERQTIAKIPYATLKVQVGSTQPEVLVLAEISREKVELWTSSAGIALYIQSGRILETRGFAHNLSGTHVLGTDWLALPSDRSAMVRSAVIRTIDLADINQFALPVEASVSPARRETLTILEADIHTLHRREFCRARNGWMFANEFWLDPSSELVWQSRQVVHPELDFVTITLLRPPG